MALEARPPEGALRGTYRPPGDKSITHRALIFAGLAAGESRVHHPLDSADTRATRAAMLQLGAGFRPDGSSWIVRGLGTRGLQAPAQPLDMGNSGTAMRLLTGVLAGQSFDSVLIGDASLSGRPMRRIIKPLEQMGARINATAAGTAPLEIHGNPDLRGISYSSPVASAQIKSCVLLAGLFAKGTTSVSEPHLSRDHTERMLPHFGIRMSGPAALEGGQTLQAADVDVPADPSSAAFSVAAALLVPDSELLLTDVGLNPTRSAFFHALKAMGGDIEFERLRTLGGEPVGDIRVRYSGRLRGIDLPVEWIPAMIDEIPALMVLAATAEGVTRIRDAAELRVKESDRLDVMGRGLTALGISVRDYPDGVDVMGGRPASGSVAAANDHRCAMSFAVLGQVIPGGVLIDGADFIDTSYPDFAGDLRGLGAALANVQAPSPAGAL